MSSPDLATHFLQAGPLGSTLPFVDNKIKVPSQYTEWLQKEMEKKAERAVQSCTAHLVVHRSISFVKLFSDTRTR